MKELFGRENGGEKIAESREVSVHPDGLSGCEGGTLAQYLKENPDAVDQAGSPFPVLVKYIDAKNNLSVQVHPNDEYAQAHEGDNGKTEMWYIVQADEGAGIYCGFKRDTTKEEFLRKVQDGTVEELLNFIPVRAGDCFLIKAGTVHAIGAGCVICEVQQSSNVTYRVYDYNRRDAQGNLRPLHIDKAAEVIDFNAFRDETGEAGAVLKKDLIRECGQAGIHPKLKNNTSICNSILSLLYACKSETVIIPIQDIFLPDSESRIIMPSVIGNNRDWKFHLRYYKARKKLLALIRLRNI